MIESADQALVGILPVSGGMLDQTYSFCQCFRFIGIDEAAMRGKK